MYDKIFHSCFYFIQKKSATTKIGEFFKLPSFRRKNKSGKSSAPGSNSSGGDGRGDTVRQHSSGVAAMSAVSTGCTTEGFSADNISVCGSMG